MLRGGFADDPLCVERTVDEAKCCVLGKKTGRCNFRRDYVKGLFFHFPNQTMLHV